jgi:hypothetical protein
MRGDNADPLSGMGGGEQSKRYSLEFYAQGHNLLNHTNPLNFSGVLTSPFFGQPTSAAAPRRFEIGTRFNF